MEPEYFFDAWLGSDAKGDSLGELSQAFNRQFRAEFNGLGNGAFSINRHDPQAAWCKTDNLIRLRLEEGGPFAWDDPRYVFAFWIEEGADVTVSTDEEGGEDYTREGRGIMAYLERAIADYKDYGSGSGKVVPGSGYWEWAEGVHSGAVMNRLMNEIRARYPAFYAVEDFGDTHDSDGDTWPELDEKYRVTIGTDYLSVIALLQDLGQQYGMDPDFALHGWNDHSRDLTATIEFEKGVNIREAAERQIHASPAKSRMLVRGATKAGKIIYRWVVSTSQEAILQRREGYVEYTRTASNTILGKAGTQQLAKLRKHHDGPQTIGVTIGDGTEFADGHFVPWTDYRPGDLVKVHIPGEYSHAHVQINAIVGSESDQGEPEITLEFEETPFTESGGPARIGGSVGNNGGSGPGDCSDCPPRSEPPFQEVCPPAFVQGMTALNSDGDIMTFANNLTVGNLLVWFSVGGSGTQPDIPGVTALIPVEEIHTSIHLPGVVDARIYQKVIEASDLINPSTGLPQPTSFYKIFGIAGAGGDKVGFELTNVIVESASVSPGSLQGAGGAATALAPSGSVGVAFIWGLASNLQGAPVSGYTEAGNVAHGSDFPWGGYTDSTPGVIAAGISPASEWMAAGVGYRLDSGGCSEPNDSQLVPSELVGLVTNDGVTTTGQTNRPYVPASLRVGIRPTDPATGDKGAIQEVVPVESDPTHGLFTLSFLLPDDWEVVIRSYQASSGTATGAANTAPAPSTFALFPSDVVEEQREFGLAADVGLSFAYARGDQTGGTPDDPGTVAVLDDLTDVEIASPANAQRLRYSTVDNLWHNSSLHWEPMVDYTGSVMLDSGGNPSMHEVAY